MFKLLSHLAVSTAAAVVIAIQPMEMAMSETLPEAVSVPLQFVEAIKESPDWLASELDRKAIGSDWKIENGKLVTADVDVLKYVNRIRAFLALDVVRRDGAPFFVLPLADEKGATGTCVTRFPRDILPNLGALDFRLDQFTVPDLGAEDVRQCLVGGPSSQPYETMDRATFLSSFFDELGVLDIRNHDSLKNDPGFIKRAHDLGFFPYQGGYTGYLQLN